MANVIVPLQAIASQTFTITLGTQSCSLNIYEKDVAQLAGGAMITVAVYLDLYVSGTLIVGGVICLNGVEIVRNAYLGFVGDLVFYDTQGSSDPLSSGLGSRWILTYQPNAPVSLP